MENEDLFEKMIEERLERLLYKKSSEKELKIMEEGERILSGLKDEDHVKIEAYMNQILDNMAENERKAYHGGMRDGVRLARWICEMEQN